MGSELTVYVEPLDNHHAVKMIWQHQIVARDLRTAFGQIGEALAQTDEPLYVIVDLQSNPQFPIRATVEEALPAYRHPNLKAWLILGHNRIGKLIESTLTALTRRQNVYWFNSEADAIAYIQAEGAQQPIQ
jgi:hypothetical protein